MGRARRITGPYLDQEGRPMLLGGGTPLMQGTAAWAGPGGQFVLRDSKTDLLAFHADDGTTGRPTLEISTLSWEDGWPRVGMLPGERPQGAIASSRFD